MARFTKKAVARKAVRGKGKAVYRVDDTPAGTVLDVQEPTPRSPRTWQVPRSGNLLREQPSERYPYRSLEDEKRHLKTELDRIERWIRSKPELFTVFEQHALGRNRLATSQTTFETEAMPDLPTERYRKKSKESILTFLERVWKPYLYYGFASVDDIKKRDPEAFATIPWPSATFAEAEGPLKSNVEKFLETYWKDLIGIGIATRMVIRKRDGQLENAILNRQRKIKELGELPDAIRPPTKSELNTRALQAPRIPPRHRARLAGTQAGRLREQASLRR